MSAGWRRRWLRLACVSGVVLLAGGAIEPVAYAATASITSAGPLNLIQTNDLLNCNVNHVGDTHSEWFQAPVSNQADDTACGTLLVVGDTLYGPANIPAGPPPTGRTPWTPVSQSAVSGTGTNADPLRVVTVVAAGTTGVQLTQTDRYVIGEESYRTDIAVSNGGTGSPNVVLYRAGDCFLQNSDIGLGEVDPSTGAVACVANPNPPAEPPPSDPPTDSGSGPSVAAVGRIEQMLPLTAGSHFFEAGFGTVWNQVNSRAPFNDTCECDTLQDNGLGISWDLTLAAGTSQTFSSLVTFSPVGRTPLTITKTADAANAPAGGTDGYTITVANPNITDVTLDTLSDTLPAGFTYLPGTTTGATTADPAIDGPTLFWPGLTVPAGGILTLHFGVTVSTVPGTYTDDAEGTAEGFTVAGTGPTAPVVVSPVQQANQPPTADPVTVTTAAGVPVNIELTGSDPDGDEITFAIATQPAHGTLSGAPPTVTYTPAAGYDGPDSFTYTASDGERTSAPATVGITVTPEPPRLNHRPVARASTVSTPAGIPVDVPLAGTDSDGDALTFAVRGGPAHGRLSGTMPDLTYTPAAGFTGADSFSYTVNDARAVSSPATVDITVTSAATVAVTPLSVEAGGVVTVEVEHFPGDTDVQIEVPGSNPITVHTDGAGAASVPFVILARDVAGLLQVTATAGPQQASCDLVLRPDDWGPPFDPED